MPRRNIYVSSRKAGDHLLNDIRAFVENKLKLKVNEKKSAVARPWERKFLGYSVTWHKQAKLKIALTSVNGLNEMPELLLLRMLDFRTHGFTILLFWAGILLVGPEITFSFSSITHLKDGQKCRIALNAKHRNI